MQILPVDLTSVIAVIMGISIILIPVIGLTARFALKPTVEALSRIMESRGAAEATQILERRTALLETQIETLEASLKRLEERSRFDAELQAGRGEPERRLPGEPLGE